jgi:hypothetical protein
MRLTSYHDVSLYTLIPNNSVATHGRNPGFFERGIQQRPLVDLRPRGVVLAKAGPFECRESGDDSDRCVPRETPHPGFALGDSLEFVLDQYVKRYDPNGYTESVPKDKREAFQHFVKRARWQHYW